MDRVSVTVVRILREMKCRAMLYDDNKRKWVDQRWKHGQLDAVTKDES